MALVVNSNVAALSAQRYLYTSTQNVTQSFRRLSSGLRVTSAADDAAALSISTKMTAQIRGLNQAIRNSNDAISLTQVADGALEETDNALQRLRELAVQSANSTLTSSDRSDVQTEVDQMLDEINRISSDTEFNTYNLLNGSFDARRFQVGAYASSPSINFSIRSAAAGSIGVSNLNLGAISGATSAISRIDNAIGSISDIRATLGALQNRFESVVNNLQNQSEQMQSARSSLIDADIAQETSVLTRNSILQQASTAILAQANQQPQLALQLLS